MSKNSNKGLQVEEPLIFEQSSPGACGVDFPEIEISKNKLGGNHRVKPIGLPNLSEPVVVRHYLRISQKNYCIDSGLYPLGSCTMKHNPRLNEKMARKPGLVDIHPLQPQSTVQGALELIYVCSEWLTKLTGMPGIAMSPAAGAHGELTGLMTIRAALEDRGNPRKTVLVPESAHGTNPASAQMCGYAIESIPANSSGRVDTEKLLGRLDKTVAAIMITNPNTCGLFEDQIVKVADAIHEIGGFLYCDGANFNAIVGRVKPGDLKIDSMHLNLHKTFSTPHGGGGPGSGPVVLSKELADYAPLPFVVKNDDRYELIENPEDTDKKPFGRIKGFHGQFGVFVRALTYMLSMGSDGLRQASGDAVLSANYLLAQLKDDLSISFEGPCMHEVLIDDRFLKDTGVTTLDFAKAMIDEGFHPMTMYFPLVVPGALLMEPTETESKESLDNYIDSVISLAKRAAAENTKHFKDAPKYTPRRRLDETAAARNPILRWKPGKNAKNNSR